MLHPMDLYAAPQRLVDIGGGRRINLHISGEGGPTVILSPGLAGITLDYMLVQPRVARFARVVSHDHAGLGYSDPGPLPRTSTAIAQDLRTALQAADIGPPYVVVGHSAGGIHMRRFAALHPDEVVGMVLVDSVTDDFEARVYGGPAKGLDRELAMNRELQAMAEAGTLTPDSEAYRTHVRVPRPELTPAVNALIHAMWTSPGYHETLASEIEAMWSRTLVRHDPTPGELGELPLIVLSAGRIGLSPMTEGDPALVAGWFAMHDVLAGLSTRGSRRTVDAGHNIPIEDPRAVADAIREVIAVAAACGSPF